jgi:hypothetical protein
MNSRVRAAVVIIKENKIILMHLGLHITITKQLFNLSVGGVIYPHFQAQTEETKLQLNGEEKEKNNSPNWYNPEWVDLTAIPKLTMYPPGTQESILKHIQK